MSKGSRVMDAEHWTFPTTRSTWWWRNTSYTTVPNPEATLDEFARVLKPGGEIILVSRVGAEAGLRRALEKWFKPAARKLGWRTEFPFERYAHWAARTEGIASDRAPRDAAVRALLADPLRQGRRHGGSHRMELPRACHAAG